MKGTKIVIPLLLMLIFTFSVEAYYTNYIIDQTNNVTTLSLNNQTTFNDFLCVDLGDPTPEVTISRFSQKVDYAFNESKAITTRWRVVKGSDRKWEKVRVFYSNTPNGTATSSILTYNLNYTTGQFAQNTVFDVTIYASGTLKTDDYLVLETYPLYLSDRKYAGMCGNLSYLPVLTSNAIPSHQIRYLNSSYDVEWARNSTSLSKNWLIADENADLVFTTWVSVNNVEEEALYKNSNNTYKGSGGTGQYTPADYLDSCIGSSNSPLCMFRMNSTSKVAQSFNTSSHSISAVQLNTYLNFPTAMHIRDSISGSNLYTSINTMVYGQGKTSGISTEYTTFHFDTTNMNLDFNKKYYLVLDPIGCTTPCGDIFFSEGAGNKYVYGESCRQSGGGSWLCGFNDLWFKVYSDKDGGDLLNSFILIPYNMSILGNSLSGVRINVSDNTDYRFSGTTASPFSIPVLLNSAYASILRLFGFKPNVQKTEVENNVTIKVPMIRECLGFSTDPYCVVYDTFTNTTSELQKEGYVYERYDVTLGGDPKYLLKAYYPLESVFEIKKENGQLVYDNITSLFEINRLFANSLTKRYNYTITSFILTENSTDYVNSIEDELQINIGLTLKLNLFFDTYPYGTDVVDILSPTYSYSFPQTELNNKEIKFLIGSNFINNLTDVLIDYNNDGSYDVFKAGIPMKNSTRATDNKLLNDYTGFGIQTVNTGIQNKVSIDNLNVSGYQEIQDIGLVNTTELKLNVTDNNDNKLYGVSIKCYDGVQLEGEGYTDINGLLTLNMPYYTTFYCDFYLAGYEYLLNRPHAPTSYYQSEVMQANYYYNNSAYNTTLYVNVKDFNTNSNISEAYVYVTDTFKGYTNTDGWIKFFGTGLEGSKSITASKNGYGTKSETHYITQGKTTEVTISLIPQTNTKLNVTVYYNNSGSLLPLNNVLVSLWKTGFDPQQKTTGSSGVLLFENLSGETYNIELYDGVFGRGYKTITSTITLVPSITTQKSYVMYLNTAPVLVSYFTVPSEINGTAIVPRYSYLEVHITPYDPDGINTTNCYMFYMHELYDENSEVYTSSSYDNQLNKLICKAYYSTQAEHTARIYLGDDEMIKNEVIANNEYFDINISVSGITDASILLEDHFDYSDTIASRGWIETDSDYTPTSNKLILSGANPTTIYRTFQTTANSDFYCYVDMEHGSGTLTLQLASVLDTPTTNDILTYLTFDKTTQPIVTHGDINVDFSPAQTNQFIREFLIDQDVYRYAIQYNVNDNTYSAYQNQDVMFEDLSSYSQNPTNYPLGLRMVYTPYYIQGIYPIELDNIVCKFGDYSIFLNQTSESGWRSDGTFDWSVCNTGENMNFCVIRTTFNWASQKVIDFVFSHLVFVLIVLILVLLLAPILKKRYKEG